MANPYQMMLDWLRGLKATDDTTGYFSDTFDKVFDTVGDPPKDPADIQDDANAISEERIQEIRDYLGTPDDLNTPESEATGVYSQIENLPGFTEWLEQQGITLGDTSSSLSGMRGLIDQMSNPDYAGAQNYVAQMAGFQGGPDETAFQQYQGMVGSLAERAQEGFTPEERALRERAIQSSVRQQEAMYQRMVQDVFAGSGSTVRMLAKADEAVQTIANSEIQQRAQLAMEELAIMESAGQQWANALQTGAISASQYFQNVQQSLGAAMQGYAMEMASIMDQNQDYLSQYQGDYNALVTQMQMVVSMAQMQLGLTQAEVELASQIYASEIAPILDQLQIQLMQQEVGGGNMMDILGLVIPAAATLLGGPIGGVAAGAAMDFLDIGDINF